MAIDTAAKRASCLGLALLFLRPGIAPTGADLDAPERLHVQGLYAGIAAGAAIVIAEPVSVVVQAQAARRKVTVQHGPRQVEIPEGRIVTVRPGRRQ